MSFGGSYNVTDPPQRGGVFVNVEVAALPKTRDVSRGVVAVVVQADWGPDNEIVEIGSESQGLAVYGSTSTAYFTITQALEGEGIPGRDGASTVLAYRIAGSAAAAADIDLNNTDTDPALTITAKYKGTRGNNLKVTVRENPGDATKNDILVLEGTSLRETYTETKADVQAFADAINTLSQFVAATVTEDGTALAAVTAQPLTGGDSGATLIAGDHTTAQAAFEAYGGFDTFAVDNLPDDTDSVRTSYIEWVNRLNSEGKLFHMVLGGPANEISSAAITRAVSHDSEYVVAITGDVTIDGVEYSSAQIASRIAGIISSAAQHRSASGAQLFGATLATPPTTTEIENMVRAGVVPLVQEAGIVRLQRAKTTYQATSVSDPNKGKFDSLFFMRRLHHTFRRFDTLVTDHIIGQTISNTPSGRDNILAMFRGELKNLEEAEVTIPGATVVYDPAQDNTGETLYILFSYRPAPGVEQILGRVSIPAA
jgi:hypothetical protein